MGEILQESHIVFRKVRFNYIEQMIQLFKCETSDISKRISDLLTFQKRRCINEECGKTYTTDANEFVMCVVQW